MYYTKGKIYLISNILTLLLSKSKIIIFFFLSFFFLFSLSFFLIEDFESTINTTQH